MEKRKEEQLEKKLEWESKKLKLHLAHLTAKAKRGAKMFNQWEQDFDEWKHLSFIPDSDSDVEAEIDINKCFMCDEAFNPNDKEVYGCDN